ncbi:tyrosine-type recombinase/integrase [Microbacterium testaceum]|uniref:tyrosine-type recombinase/integrase n=1 Tax=Microbacterium testaceum TaxID=2033 RepID=UPI00381E1062
MDTRVWIADRWMKRDPADASKKVKSAAYGKGDRWRVVWTDPDTKKETSKSFSKRADADAYRAKTEDSLRGGVYVTAQVAALTVGDAVTAWLASKKRPKGSSMARYKEAMENYVLPRWQGTLLTAVKRQDIDAWISALMDGSAPRRDDMRAHKSGLSPASVQAVYGRLNSALVFAVGQGWIRKNPATGVEIPKVKGEPVVFLTHAELEALISATREHGSASDAALVAVLGNVGIRPGEAAALTVDDVKLTARRIEISKTVTIDENRHPIVGDSPKTYAGIRDVPIPPHLLADLESLTKHKQPRAPLFTSKNGEALNLSNWRNRVWSKVTDAAGVPEGLTPKGLRHTAASLAIGAGADVLVVQRMLGHATATETLNTYAKLWPDRLDEVTAAMSKARAVALNRTDEKSPS